MDAMARAEQEKKDKRNAQRRTKRAAAKAAKVQKHWCAYCGTEDQPAEKEPCNACQFTVNGFRGEGCPWGIKKFDSENGAALE
jgi:hypothetical protein